MDLSNSTLAQPAAALPVTSAGSIDESVLEFTRRIFGGAATIAREMDPETNEECIVVTAVVTGTVEEIVAGNDRWHRNLRDVCGKAAEKYRLDFEPR